MKKLLTLLFLFTILYSPYSHSNILDNILGNMSTNDVELYDKTYTDAGYNAVLGKSLPEINFKAKIKNLNQETSGGLSIETVGVVAGLLFPLGFTTKPDPQRIN